VSAQSLTRAPWRIHAALVFLTILGLALAGQLFHWQVLERERMSTLADKQQTVNVKIPARRGDIITRDEVVLAQDIFLYTISISPAGVSKKTDRRQEFISQIAPLLKQSPETILAKLNSNETLVVLAKDVGVEIGAPIVELKNRLGSKNSDLNSIIVESRPSRQYPAGEFAAPLIGFVNAERQAANGIELYKDADLKGKDGLLSGAGNALHDEVIPYDLAAHISAVPGVSLKLTMDAAIQQAVEAELSKAIKDLHAAGACAIVMESKTGAILAMASLPTTDLNRYFDSANLVKYANSCTATPYEPGSVFTMITAASAMDAGTATVATMFDDNGSFLVGGFAIKNHNDMAPGTVSLVDVFRQSMDVEAAKMSVGLGANRYYQYLAQYGIGVKTGIEIAGESAGDLKTAGDGRWHESDLGRNAYGQDISATPIQMIAAVNVLASQGKMMKPYLISETRAADGLVTHTNPTMMQQVIRPETAQSITRLLDDAVNGNASSRAIVPGYRVAGMSASAPYPVIGLADPKIVTASYAGYLPADDPRYVIFVKLDKPQVDDATWQAAAPVFSNIAKQVVMITGLPPDSVRLSQTH
jgi:cell division protein FtsI (penicillin-binding protein 3)